LGLPVGATALLAERDVRAIEQFLRAGGRVVLAYRPLTTSAEAVAAGIEPREQRLAGAAERERSLKRRSTGLRPEANEWRRVSLNERWGWRHLYRELPRNDAGEMEPLEVQRRQVGPLPERLPWHSGLVFSDLHASWSVVYTRDADPVVVERSFGLGSIVLCGDAYLFSNEALRRNRQPEFLAWMAGSARTLYFDEQHHGIAERPGVAALVRKYRLHGLVVGGALLAALFLWKNASPLVPPCDRGGPGHGEVVLGRDATAGFVNLLRRSVAPSELLAVCLAEWRRGLGRSSPSRQARAEQAATLLAAAAARPPRQRDPVGTYRAVARVLGDRSRAPRAEPQA
jgi:hypothetical protein